MPYSHGGADKTPEVREMFNSIAPAYDFMNHAMTLGMHRLWRNRALSAALRLCRKNLGHDPHTVLDVATGTGDLLFALQRRIPEASLTGIDLSEGMLEIARRKAPGNDRMEFIQGDCLDLPFADNSFDLLTVAYGVRNFADTLQGYRQMLRVLRPGGVLCVVELSVPLSTLPRLGYNFYTKCIIPAAGRLISHDPRAYSYLPESIEAAPQRADMTAVMARAGFQNPSFRSLFPGVVTIYLASKPF